MIVIKTLAIAAAVPVLLWLGAVLYSAGKEVHKAYKKAAYEQDMHYRGWMR